MLQFVPRKAALCADVPTTLELLLRIDPDLLPSRPASARVPLNLGLVLDRSGSMKGEKLALTILAACRAVAELQPTDFLTVVAFDEGSETIFAGHVENPEAIYPKIKAIEERGMTDLFDGWNRGARELRQAVHPTRLSRLVVLTDGEANKGETGLSAICQGVAQQAQLGVQTTTLGFGAGYNEQLLRSMASSGHGNHAYIENAQRLGDFFAEEMHSLLRARGTSVRLRLQPAAGVQVQWLAEVMVDREGRVCLADLVEGQPLSLVVRLEVCAPPPAGELLALELSWHDLDAGHAQTTHSSLTLPAVDQQTWQALPGHPEVEMYLALARANRLRNQAMKLLNLNAADVALQWLDWARQLAHLPPEELRVLDDLAATVERGDRNASYKKAAMYGHGHGHGHAHSSSHYSQSSSELSSGGKRQRKLLPIGHGPILQADLQGNRPPWPRIEGMLRGHFFGERLVRGNRGPLGEGASLSRATLGLLLQGPLDPEELARALNEVPLLHPTTSQQKFRRELEKGTCSLLEIGSVSAGCAALRRMCPLFLGGTEDLFIHATLATVITHRDNLAITASLGYLALLWQLLQQPLLPAPDFYAHTFLQAIQGLECGEPYQCQSRTPGLQGWQGHLKDFLPLALGLARERSLSAAEAMRAWGSGPYLLEVVPSLLYILELHAHDPAQALKVATTDTYEADTLGMLVGAALGALHGSQPGWFLHEELEELLETLHKRWK